jgi:hypothetical protein
MALGRFGIGGECYVRYVPRTMRDAMR